MKSIKTEYPFYHYTEWRNEKGELHRENGPAREYSDGRKDWYYQGKYIDCSSQKQFEQLIKLKVFW